MRIALSCPVYGSLLYDHKTTPTVTVGGASPSYSRGPTVVFNGFFVFSFSFLFLIFFQNFQIELSFLLDLFQHDFFISLISILFL